MDLRAFITILVVTNTPQELDKLTKDIKKINIHIRRLTGVEDTERSSLPTTSGEDDIWLFADFDDASRAEGTCLGDSTHSASSAGSAPPTQAKKRIVNNICYKFRLAQTKFVTP